MNHLVGSRGLSTRRACILIGQPTSTHYYKPAPALKQQRTKIETRIHELAAEHDCAGYRTIHSHLRLEGFAVNHKRVQRVWRQSGLSHRTPPKKRRVPGHQSPSSVIPLVSARSQCPGLHSWHGRPKAIRMDNGPELIAAGTRDAPAQRGCSGCRQVSFTDRVLSDSRQRKLLR